MTGSVSGLVVLDVDPRHGGGESLAELERACGGLTPTLVSRTGGGGWHYVYRHPGGRIKGRAHAFGDELPGLDIKGEGGYFVAPPSLHVSGERYAWEDASVEPVEMPDVLNERLIARLIAQGGRNQSAERGGECGDGAEEGEYREGTRNSALTSLAGRLRAWGLEQGVIEAALLAENAAKCRPPLDEAEVRGIAASVSRYAARSGGKGGTKGGTKVGISAATRLMVLAEEAELFHTPDGDAYATITVAEHRETWAIRSGQFRQWLARRYYEASGGVPNNQAMQDALALLEGHARFEGKERRVFLRVAESGEALYVDLANERWESVEVTRDGWRVVAEAPVKFRRTQGMEALPLPVRGGSIEELRAFVNVGGEGDWRLMVAWLVAALREHGPYSLLILQGEQGTAKSTTARALRGVVDPCEDAVRALSRDERDLVIAASSRQVLAYDNLSGVAPWMADVLCRLATGESFATRLLFSNDGEKIFNVARPLILNGIEEIATRPDLAERALVLTLPPIDDERRRTERDFWREYAAAKPRILGALLDGASAALRRLPLVHVARLPRMADFAVWATAAEAGFGWPAGAFMDAYRANRGEAVEAALEADPIANTVRMLVKRGGDWTGTATELLEVLGAAVPEQARKGLNWPRSPRALASRLRRAATFLRAVGIEMEYRRENTQRLITIGSGSVNSASRGTGEDSVTTVTTVTTVTSVVDSPACSSLAARGAVTQDGALVTQDGALVTQTNGRDAGASPADDARCVGTAGFCDGRDGRFGHLTGDSVPPRVGSPSQAHAGDNAGMETRSQGARSGPKAQPPVARPSWWPRVEHLVGRGMRQDEAIRRVLVERGSLRNEKAAPRS